MIFSTLIRFAKVLAVLLFLNASSTWAVTHTTSPNLSVWISAGTGIDFRAQSTNATNPITNAELTFEVRKKTGAFTSNGVLCLCEENTPGVCSERARIQYSAGNTSLIFPAVTLSAFSIEYFLRTTLKFNDIYWR